MTRQSRYHPGRMDRRQGIDDRPARGADPRGGGQGRPDHLLPGAVLRPVLRGRPGPEVLRLRRAHPRPDDRAVPGARQGTRPGDRAADLRGGQRGRVLQHGRGDRRRRVTARQVPQAPHPEPAVVLGEVLLPPGQPGLPGLRHRGRPGRRLHLLRPALPGGLARARAEQRADSSSTRRPPNPGCPTGCGSSSSRPPRPRTSTSSPRTTGSARRSASSGRTRRTSTARATSSTRAATTSATSRPRTRRRSSSATSTSTRSSAPATTGSSTATAARSPTPGRRMP